MKSYVSIFVLFIIILTGCGTENAQGTKQEYQQAKENNDLPSQFGSEAAGKKMKPAFPYWDQPAWERGDIIIEKDMKTNLLDGLFVNVPGPIQRPNQLVSVELQKLPNGTKMQLLLEDYDWEKKTYTSILEKEAVRRQDTFLKLPNEENKVYRLTANVVNKQSEQLLDAVQYRFYVPYQTAELNVKITAEEKVADQSLEVKTMNWGPADVEVSKTYSISKWEDKEWRLVYPNGPQTDEYVFERLPPGEEMKSEIDVSDLKPGLYRFENGINVGNTDIAGGTVLAAVFEVVRK
ncbi:immunoglobulin-like domain-containing protein [Pseudobacillus wudalianchiensis]|uniref:Intracellular proteinase inhibitor BsuPI domain-containing protein n=1 Tax=Pseudobacillus wudalianchiensis TaxID=1743143 RepID=A0A1B9AMK0_9BACI|nr:hypothetical protein [Bacillus wudalianchiensis]OCA85147.1 hypothetical protein A8F95_10730 [Bacillus wudalianchiensis]